MIKKVLVIDDVKSELQLISFYLEQAGYIVTTAENGVEALQKIQVDRPDAIVTDLVMPELTGLELCRRLKKDPTTAHIPVIACTTKDRKIDRNWAKKQGVTSYIVKPCTAEQLAAAVRYATL